MNPVSLSGLSQDHHASKTLPAFYVHSKHVTADGTISAACTFKCEAKLAPLWHHTRGLSYTATGYGSRIPTQYMVKFNGRWRRVYCRIFSNSGTCYIGKWATAGEQLIVSEG